MLQLKYNQNLQLNYSVDAVRVSFHFFGFSPLPSDLSFVKSQQYVVSPHKCTGWSYVNEHQWTDGRRAISWKLLLCVIVLLPSIVIVRAIILRSMANKKIYIFSLCAPINDFSHPHKSSLNLRHRTVVYSHLPTTFTRLTWFAGGKKKLKEKSLAKRKIKTKYKPYRPYVYKNRII